MRYFKPFLGLLLGMVVALSAYTENLSIPWYKKIADNQFVLRVDLFLVSTCPHCHQADAFFTELSKKVNWIEVNRYVINQDKNAILLFNQYLKQQNVHDFSTPAIFFCNSRWVGFTQARNSGQNLMQGLNYCYQQIQKDQKLTEPTVKALQQMATSYWLSGSIKETTAQSYYLLPLLAALGALNPCSLIAVFVLFALVSLQSNFMRRLLVGAAFLIVLGLVSIIQQQDMALFYAISNHLRIPAFLIGFMVIGYLFSHFYKKNNPLVFALLISLLLAFAVQFYQQACIPNFSMIFQQQLLAKTASATSKIILMLTYNIIYAACLLLAVFILFTLSKITFIQKHKGTLLLFNYVLLFLLGLALILYPTLLSSFGFNFFIIFLACGLAWLASRFLITEGKNYG